MGLRRHLKRDFMALLQESIADAPLLADGAWATELQLRGLAVEACPDAWNLTHPQEVEDVAATYVRAGCRILMTNTFGANRVALVQHGLQDRVAEINRAGAEISRRAAGNVVRVFGSVGSTRKRIADGEITEAAASSAFTEQVQALAEGGADAIVLETMTDLAEVRLAVEAVKRIGLPVIASMFFNTDQGISQAEIEKLVSGLTRAGADGVGMNCMAGTSEAVSLCRRIRCATRLPFWVKPNAGLPHWEHGKFAYSIGPDAFVGQAMAFIEAGVDVIGGCCGVGPDHIQALSSALQKRHEESA
jgi:5-methyltetrahydrofolate--homocysteine methyltransferase